jgi:hypothetical protein
MFAILVCSPQNAGFIHFNTMSQWTQSIHTVNDLKCDLNTFRSSEFYFLFCSSSMLFMSFTDKSGNIKAIQKIIPNFK